MNSAFPFMGAPQSAQGGGLLGAAENYSYPMTSGLLNSLSAPDYTQQALQLAGNPHAGPYANAPGFAPGSGGVNMTAGSTSGGSSVAGGLLGALSKNPQLIKDGIPLAKEGINAVSGLFGDGLSAYGSGAAANGALAAAGYGGAAGTSAALGSTAGLGSSIAAGNDAALASQIAAEGETGAAAGTGATAGGSSAATGAGLGATAGAATALGVAALPLALAAFVPTGETASWWQGLTNQINGTGQYANMSQQDRQFNQSAGAIELMSMLKQGEPTPYSSQQLTAMGITPKLIAEAFPTISSPSGTARGWLGGSARGMSRI